MENKDIKKIVSVILNYKNFSETIECISSLKKQNYINHEIVVVDNGSHNNSVDELNKKFSNDEHIFILESESNVGFAKGNNIGIKFALEKFNPDGIFVVNSDCICSEKLFEITSNYLDDPTIGVINPFVYNLNNRMQTPAVYTNEIYDFIKKTVKKMNRARFTTLPGIIYITKFLKYIRTSLLKNNSESVEKTLSNYKYIIQGCSFFLTKSFLTKYSGLYPNTFLYFEEINLAMYLEKADLISIVLPNNASVLHKEAGSSVSYRNNVRKKLKQNLLSYKNSKKMYTMSYEEIKKTYMN